jgi:hypothetical protein
MPHIPMEVRRWIYGVSLAAVPLFVALGILEDEIAPLVIALIGAVIAPSLALANMSPDNDLNPHWDEEDEADLAELEEEDHRE